MNNVTSFFDTSIERAAAPILTSSLSFDSICFTDADDDDCGKSHGMSMSHGVTEEFGQHKGAVAPLLNEQEDDSDEEFKQIRTANLLQRTLYMELEKIKNSTAEFSEHPMLQGEVRSQDSEVFVTGELRSKAFLSVTACTEAIATVMNDSSTLSWQAGFSVYLQRRRSQSAEVDEEQQKQLQQNASMADSVVSTRAGGIASDGAFRRGDNSATAMGDSVSSDTKLLEKRPPKGQFLFGNVNWSAAGAGSTSTRSPDLSGNSASNSDAGLSPAASAPCQVFAQPRPLNFQACLFSELQMSTTGGSELFTIVESLTPTKDLGGGLDSPCEEQLRLRRAHSMGSSPLGSEAKAAPPILKRHSDVRKAFTEFHNHTASENASPFLGEDNSAHGGKSFNSEMFSNCQRNLKKQLIVSGSRDGSAEDDDDLDDDLDEGLDEDLDNDFESEGFPSEQEEQMAEKLAVKGRRLKDPGALSIQAPVPVTEGAAGLSELHPCPPQMPSASLAIPPATQTSSIMLPAPELSRTQFPCPPPLNTSNTLTPSDLAAALVAAPPSSSPPNPKPSSHSPSTRTSYMHTWRTAARPTVPCFLPMPGGRTFAEGKQTGARPLDMSAVLQSIPLDAWILPYIVTASILLAERKLPDKQLTDISFQQDLSRVSSNSQISGHSRSNSDLATVTEDAAFIDFSTGHHSRNLSPRSPSPFPESQFDPHIGLDIDGDASLEGDISPPSTYLVNSFKYLNPFRHRTTRSKTESNDLDDSYFRGERRGVVRRRSSSFGDLTPAPPAQQEVAPLDMRRVSSHADVAGYPTTSSNINTNTNTSANTTSTNISSNNNNSNTTNNNGHIGSKSRFNFGQMLGIGSRNTDQTTDSAGHSDLIFSYDQHGVYLSSSQHGCADVSATSRGGKPSLSPGASPPDRQSAALAAYSSSTSKDSGLRRSFSSATNIPDSFADAATVTTPPFISSLFMNPNCTDLGTIEVCRDYTAPLSNTNAKSSAADNQEDEDADVDETRPVGFINLSDALVEHLHPPSPNISRSSSGMFRSLSSASIGIQQCSSGVSLDDDWSGDQVAPVVSVRYYASAAPTAQRRVVVLRCSTRKETLKLMQLLLIASRLSVQDLYDYDKINETKPDLGTGRYSKCFKAVNKRTRSRLLGDDESSCDEGASANESGSGGDKIGAGGSLDDLDELSDSESEPLKRRLWKGSFLKKKKKKKKKDVEVGGAHSAVDETSTTSEERLAAERALIYDGHCAMKLVDKRQYWDRVRMGKERGDSLCREILAQAHLLNTVIAASQSTNPCPSNEEDSKRIELPIVQLYGVFETRGHFALELELMQSIDLSEKLQLGEFSEEQAKHIAIQLVQAVALCQVNGMVHRDIKLTNIGFPMRTSTASPAETSSTSSPSSTEPLQIKLGDFGMAGFVERDGKLRGRCGTPGYVAPEILKSGKREGYGIAVDMFSVGCVIYTLLCGYEPFFGETDAELIEANKSGEYAFPLPEWGRVSDEAKDFVAKLLDPFPSRRLTVHEALDHPWMVVYGGTINYPPKVIPNSHSTCVVS